MGFAEVGVTDGTEVGAKYVHNADTDNFLLVPLQGSGEKTVLVAEMEQLALFRQLLDTTDIEVGASHPDFWYVLQVVPVGVP